MNVEELTSNDPLPVVRMTVVCPDGPYEEDREWPVQPGVDLSSCGKYECENRYDTPGSLCDQRRIAQPVRSNTA
jgi:hypothetical protein